MKLCDVQNIRNIKRLLSLIPEIFIEVSVIYDGTTDYRVYKIYDNDLILLFEVSNFERIQGELKDYLTPLGVEDEDQEFFVSKKGKIYIYNELSDFYKMCNHRFIPVEPAFVNIDWPEMVSRTSEYQNGLLKEEDI
jgi:hypothetical protein